MLLFGPRRCRGRSGTLAQGGTSKKNLSHSVVSAKPKYPDLQWQADFTAGRRGSSPTGVSPRNPRGLEKKAAWGGPRLGWGWEVMFKEGDVSLFQLLTKSLKSWSPVGCGLLTSKRSRHVFTSAESFFHDKLGYTWFQRVLLESDCRKAAGRHSTCCRSEESALQNR